MVRLTHFCKAVPLHDIKNQEKAGKKQVITLLHNDGSEVAVEDHAMLYCSDEY